MRIYIFPNLNKENSKECTLDVISFLSSYNCEILISSEHKGLNIESEVRFIESLDELEGCDIIVCIGGDGTILRAKEIATKYSCSLLGINCGRVGFMTTIEKDDIERLKQLFCNEFKIEKRMLLEIIIEREDGEKIYNTALNDCVITKDFNTKIHDFTVLADDVVVSSLRADGLIFSTPTGSSAYSLSAGGALIEPTVHCIEFTQICPHSLFNRSMIISPERIIEVKFSTENKSYIHVSIDGNEPIKLSSEDKIIISKSDKYIEFIDLFANNYFNSIGTKLMKPTKGS